ncbi:MAG: hypothetical protein JNL25_06705 [Rhodospirillaceae bacterium]|nr:hypothetical protein [Rhodospirillaceae bacterium]
MSAPFPVLTLTGDAGARGRAHGEACRALIARHVALWRETSATPDHDWRTIAMKLLAGTGFAAAAQRWTPDAWSELQGIAAGANQTFADVLLLNLTDEQWWITNARHAEACTSFACRAADGAVWSGQNLDITKWMDGLQVVLRYPLKDGGSAVAGTLAGTLAMTGINSHGVSICCNTLLQLPPTRRGLPCLFVIRGVLECRSRDQAMTFLRDVTHASGLHYLIADPLGWVGVECDAEGIRQVESAPDRYGHTNHPKLAPESASATSRDRLLAINAALDQGRAIAALSERPLCRDGTSAADPIGFTIFSGIWRNEAGATPRFCAGPPLPKRYHEVPQLA